MKVLMIRVDPHLMAWLEFVGIKPEQIQKATDQIVHDRLRQLVWQEISGEEDVCAECGHSWGWSPHRPACKYHKDNLPEALNGRLP